MRRIFFESKQPLTARKSDENADNALEYPENKSLQRHEDITQHGRRQNYNQEDKTVTFKHFVLSRQFVGQEVAQDVRTVKRRNRQHVENREVDIIDDYHLKNDDKPFRHWQIEFNHNDEQNREDKRRN